MKPSLVIPAAVLIGGAIIAGAVFWIERPASAPAPENAVSRMHPVDESDHILGNPAAPIVFVEYCDIDSPFCKSFQTVMETVIANYGADGKVAWVYRHLPIASQHPNAENEAEAAECAAEQGGSGAFFAFIRAIQAAAPGAAQFDASQYGAVARSAGIDAAQLSSCLSAHTYEKRVANDANNALAAGATGSPYTVMLVQGVAPIPISGALSYDQLNGILAAALTKVK